MKEEIWDSVRESILKDVAGLHNGAFAAIDYDQEVKDAASPYAQVTRVGSRYWCEIASNTLLPGDSWPLHRDTLRAAGWSPPDEHCPNWSSEWSNASAATAAVIHGLRYGRSCSDPVFWECRTATLPRHLGGAHRVKALFRRTHRP